MSTPESGKPPSEPSPPRPEVRANGLLLRRFFKTLGVLRGEAVVEQVKQRADPELLDKLTRGLIFTGVWYPVAWYRQLLGAARAVTGEDASLPWALAKRGVAGDMSAIYAAFMWVATPQYLFTKAAAIFNRYYDGGHVEVSGTKPGEATGHWVDCVGFDENLWSATLGGVEVVLEAAGGHDINIRVLEGGGDSDSLVAQANWL